uniref:HTH CENPB-type domain-containing protein n=1 Tax=Pelusios castaneus TaxID=367368 RepID=A0A8C8STQ7_9SAUR
MSKTKRLAYKIPFKLEVVKYAKEHGNRAAERHFGPPPTEKMIREWRKQEDHLQKLDKTKHTFRGHAAKWPQLEMDMKEWITLHWNMGFSVSTKMIIYEAKRIAVEKGIKDFTGSPSWCYRFMRRSGLAMRTKTRISVKEEIVARSFKKCGISNVLDGTEDHIVYEDSEESDISDCEQLSFINSDTSDDEFLGVPEN